MYTVYTLLLWKFGSIVGFYTEHIVGELMQFLCPGALHYAPYSFSLFSNKICPAVQILFIFLNCTSAIKKYYAPAHAQMRKNKIKVGGFSEKNGKPIENIFVNVQLKL